VAEVLVVVGFGFVRSGGTGRTRRALTGHTLQTRITDKRPITTRVEKQLQIMANDSQM